MTDVAGRELDVLIAEKVMGWTWYKTGRGARMLCEPHHGQLADGSEPIANLATFSVPLYSSDIAAAWSIVEKMQELGWTFAIELFEDNGNYSAYFKNTQNRDRYVGNADTAPLAICLAALKALGGEHR